MPTNQNTTQFNSAESYIESVDAAIDLSEMMDSARDYVLNGQTNRKVIIQGLENEYLRAGGDSDTWWFNRHQLAQQAVKTVIAEAVASNQVDLSYNPIWPEPTSISFPELNNAKGAPDCIVEDYLYADVLLFPAPGGTGKTTLKLRELAAIAGGAKLLYGREIYKNGPVVFITGEDRREQLIARLRNVISENGMLGHISKILKNFYICDCSDGGFKLTNVEHEIVKPSIQVDELIEYLRAVNPLVVVIDPAISFGVGEARINDAEQGLIEVARKIRNAINCCVQYIHHTGKQSARDKSIDQYAGRGGSAFADGARMVHVLTTLTPTEWLKETSTQLYENEQGLRLSLPKMTYCKPQKDIFIRRHGFAFEHAHPSPQGPATIREQEAETVHLFLKTELDRGFRHTKNTLEAMPNDIGLKRANLRRAISQLLVSGRVILHEAPRTDGKREGSLKYLHPLGSPTPSPNLNETIDSEPTSLHAQFASPPYRDINGGEATQPPLSPISPGSPKVIGDPTANLANPVNPKTGAA